MKVELEDLSHDESRKDWTYIHDCTLKVKETDDSGSITETEKKGYIIQGKDMLYLNSSKVYLPNLPTEHQDIAGAFEEVLGKLQDEGGGDDWSPPEWWIPVPEPNEYDIYILLQAQPTGNNNAKMKIAFSLYKESTSYPGAWVTGDNIYCDFGDGTDGVYSGSITHAYTEPGQYLVHIIGNEKSMKFNLSSLSQNLLIFKSGEKIICDLSSGNFNGQSSLAYVKINNPEGIYIGNRQIFQSCVSLKKTDFKIKADAASIGVRAFEACRVIKGVDFENCKLVGELAFQGCTTLKTISFPNATSIAASAFSGCYSLESVYLPNCTSIGEEAFYQCYNLQEIVVSEDCTFGTNCFQNCYSLYPRPDGSVN